jgi:hypothetical protein
MQIVHVFEEERAVERRDHMRAYFGVTPEDGDRYDNETGQYIICYCGGKFVPLASENGDVLVAGVWHFKGPRRRPREVEDGE